MVPPALIGPAEGSPQPPPVRPEIRPMPALEGSLTYVGQLPKTGAISIPALRAYGKGEIEIKGETKVRLSGDGVLWVDKGSSVTLDPATTGTKTADSNGWSWAGFRGVARVSGSPVNLRIKGDRLMVAADGRGTVTMRGDKGIFRLTQAQGQLVSGVWDPAGMTKDFAQVAAKAEVEGSTRPLPITRVKPGASPAGIIPAVPPPARVYPRPLLPSERGTTATPSVAATTRTVSAAPTTRTVPAAKP
jgi:hypothetical protein